MSELNWDAICDDSEKGYDLSQRYPGLFGWKNPLTADSSQRNTHEDIVSKMPSFAIEGPYQSTDQALLWKPIEKALGKPMRTFRQITGSCVGNGAGQACNALMALEIFEKGEAETFKGPSLFWLAPYGESRRLAGWEREGEGSFGSTMAKALAEYGMFSHDCLPNLPGPTDDNGLTWGKKAEMFWSSARNQRTVEGLEKVKGKNTFTTAKINSVAEAIAAITNGYPLTVASMWGGKMRCPIVEGVLLNRKGLMPWPHQMCCLGYWKHPALSDIFWIQNSWGVNAHGKCPTGAPEGGFWIQAEDLDRMIGSEVYAVSNFNGFPAREIDWSTIV